MSHQEGMTMAAAKLRVEFVSKDGSLCRGYLSIPQRQIGESKNEQNPIVILAHGYAMWQVFEPIPSVANALLKAGICTLTFDYRTFGESDGQPRSYVNPKAHVEDWKSAIHAVTNKKIFPASKEEDHAEHTVTKEERRVVTNALGCVDAKRIGLWGLSFGGGHVIVTGSDNFENVKCIVSALGCMDASKIRIKGSLSKSQIFRSILWDLMMNVVTFGWRSYVRLVGPEGTSVLSAGDKNMADVKKYVGPKYWEERDIHPQNMTRNQPIADGTTKWINGMPAASLLNITGYSPLDSASKVECPCLFIAATSDDWTPEELIEEASKKVKNGTYVEFKCHHMGFVDDKKARNELFKETLTFLGKHL
eukprot:jgi/Bigna1/126352/aug1.2_g1060